MESKGSEENNMSAINGPVGIYEPREMLEDCRWSIGGLDISKLLDD